MLVFHERDTTAIDPKTFQEIEKVALEIMEQVCKHFKNTQKETHRTVLSVNELIRQVKIGELTENEKQYRM